MKETITTRVMRIISGSANKLVEILESSAPEVVMEETIREIDSAIYDVRSELGKITANKHITSNRLNEANRKHEDLVDKIELAIRENREDLAETAVAQQMDLEAQIPVLENSIQDSTEKENELNKMIEALQAKKREMRDELRTMKDAKDSAASVTSAGTVEGKSNVADKVARAEAAFDRIMEQTTGVAGGGKTDLKSGAQLAELEELSRKNRIQERLAQIKANMSSK